MNFFSSMLLIASNPFLILKKIQVAPVEATEGHPWTFQVAPSKYEPSSLFKPQPPH